MEAENKIDMELLQKLTAHCGALLGTPERPKRVAYKIFGTENLGILELRKLTECWCLRVSARHRSSDWAVSHYLWDGSRESILERLHTPEGIDEIMESMVQLSARVDDHERYGE